jgi:hypothetical protein
MQLSNHSIAIKQLLQRNMIEFADVFRICLLVLDIRTGAGRVNNEAVDFV